MNIKNKRKLLIVVFVIFAYLFLTSQKDSYGIYSETLSTRVYLSVLDPNTTCEIIYHTNSTDTISNGIVTCDDPAGVLTTPVKDGYNFTGWYLSDNTTKVTHETIISADTDIYAHWQEIVCKKAAENTLHNYEQCDSTGECVQNYSPGEYIEYGQIAEDDTPLSGDAYDCNVYHDNTFDTATERFYYVREIEDIVNDTISEVLVYYTSFDDTGRIANATSIDGKIYTYDAGKDFLPVASAGQNTPATSVWDNPYLTTFDNSVARYINKDDLTQACGGIIYDSAHYMDGCDFFMQTSKYQSSSIGRSGIVVEKDGSQYYRIDTRTGKLAKVKSTSENSVRPVIEISNIAIEGYREKQAYTVTYDNGEAPGIGHFAVYENEPIGELLNPRWPGHRFLGWYLDSTFTTPVDPVNTLITADTVVYALWEEKPDNLITVFSIPGTCTFGGNGVDITSPNNDCISTINATNSPIDYTTSLYASKYYIDTLVSLYSEDNYEKDYEVGFTIDYYKASSNSTQAVLFNAKLENSTLSYPGLVFRKNNNNYNFEIAETIKTVKINEHVDIPSTISTPIDVIIKREDGIVSYNFDGSGFQDLQDTNNTSDYFNHYAWFGGAGSAVDRDATTSTATSNRFLVATLSNMYIKLEQDEMINITFLGYGGTVSPDDEMQIPKGSSISSLPTITNYSNYYFVGWYTQEQGGELVTTSTVFDADTTLHARYLPYIRVYFDAHAGTASANYKDVPTGYEIGDLPTATPSNQNTIFIGWYTAEQNGELVTTSRIINSSTTFHALYASSARITYNLDGGTADFDYKDVEPGSVAGAFPNISKSGFIFGGWFQDSTFSTPAEETTPVSSNTTFYVRWIPDSKIAGIGNNYYDTLQLAIDDVPTTGERTVVTLFQNTAETLTVAAGKNIEFDFQNLTVSNNGNHSVITNSGTIEIKNGTISSTSSTGTAYTIRNETGGILTISGGHLSATGSNVVKIFGGNVSITGGYITSTAGYGAIDIESGATFTMSDGLVEVTGTRQALYNNGGTVTIRGNAHLTATATARAAVQNNAGTMYIKGGTISSSGNRAVVNGGNSDAVTNGILYIGDNTDGVLSTTTPYLQGKTNGLYVNPSMTATVYDGLFEGKTSGINDTTRIVHDSNVDFDTTGMNDQYHMAYLVQIGTRYNITFNANGGTGGKTVEYLDGDPLGELDPASKTNTRFLGWFTDATGGDKVNSTTLVTADATYYAHYTTSTTVCRRATAQSLHEYSGTTFGQVQIGPTLDPGDAYDCDVNGDGTYNSTNERFYYLKDDENGNAVFIYYNNTSQESVSTGINKCNATPIGYPASTPTFGAEGPTTAYSELPTTTEWPNVTLYTEPRQIVNEHSTDVVGSGTASTFEYTGASARLATFGEIAHATLSTINGTANELAGSDYTFLFENTVAYGSCNSSYWLETPKSDGTGEYIIDASNISINISTGSSAVRPVIEVPYDSIEMESTYEEFDIIPTAMRTYFNNIDTWVIGQSDSVWENNAEVNNHISFDTAMGNNLSTNNCVNFNGDNRDSVTSGTIFCDQPNEYDTGVTGTVNVYEYDAANDTVSSQIATYVTANNGKLYNMIPNQIYYWESASDPTVNGYVKPIGERRIIKIDNSQNNLAHQVRNVRDLGGIKVDTNDDGVIDGIIKYGKLFRGEKIWGGDGNTIPYLTKLGITHEIDLREANGEIVPAEEDSFAQLNNGSDIRYDLHTIVHYDIPYTAYVASPLPNYWKVRTLVKELMENYVDAYQNDYDYSIYFHCRIGADRTGTLAYILEGLLGAPEEERYRDYELTVFFGLDERTRFYFRKNNVRTKFTYMKDIFRNVGNGTKEDVVEWFLLGSANVAERASDIQLIEDFRTALVDYYD